MRLTKVARGHRWREKLRMALLRMRLGMPLHDLTRTLHYRPEFFGGPFKAWQRTIMRALPRNAGRAPGRGNRPGCGARDWSRGELELLAAYTSQLNKCPFCQQGHRAFAVHWLGDAQPVAAALDEGAQCGAESDEAPGAALRFLKKLTLAPDLVGPDDIAPLRAADLSEAAIEQAIHVGICFNVVNRVANALGFVVPGQDYFMRLAQATASRKRSRREQASDRDEFGK